SVRVERCGAARLKTPRTFRIETITAGTTLLRTTPTMGEFALGMFLDLSQEEMLAIRGFESRESGVEVSAPLTNGTMVTTTAGFEELLIDPNKRPDVPAPQLPFGVISAFGAPPPSGAPVQIRRERFTLVDNKLVTQSIGKTFFEARALLKPTQRIVPESEALA